MLTAAEPHFPAFRRPLRHELGRHHAAVGNCPGEHWIGRRKYVAPQLGVNAVGTDDDIALSNGTVCQFHAGGDAVPLEADAAMTGADDALRQGLGQYLHEVGAMHAVGRIPAG